MPILASFGAGLFGSFFVSAGVDAWYQHLVKPPLSPPDYVFFIVWLALYALMGIACAIVWLHDTPTDHHANWVRFFFIHLLFNAGWTIFFFGFHSILLSVVIILLVFFMVLGLTATAYHIDKRASYLLMPYLLWLAFAAYLTVGMWALN